MKNVISLLLLSILSVQSISCLSQTKSQKLKAQQKKLEKEISYTKKLLSQVKSNSENSYNELRLIENQIKNREELVNIFDNQVRMSEIKILDKNREIIELEQKLKLLIRQYRKMLLYSYKNRNNQAKAIYVLSSNSYNEALQRNQYLKKIDDIQKRQIALIKQHQELIRLEINSLEEEKQKKKEAIEAKKIEREEIAKDLVAKENIFNKYKEEENRLNNVLAQEEKKRAELKRKVNQAIQNEINEARRKEEERLKRLREKEKNSGTTNTNMSSEGSIIGKNFLENKGRLPWPVNNGQITEKYGTNAHPTLKGVTTVNNGIDISCNVGSMARSVFDGEVTSIFEIPGSGKVIIIKHGNYMTVYSNLSRVLVKSGEKIKAKQNIGTIIANSQYALCHFEIHLISNGVPKTMNPSLWIGR